VSTSNKYYKSKRLRGTSRYLTSKAIAEDYSSSKVNNIIIASGLNYPNDLIYKQRREYSFPPFTYSLCSLLLNSTFTSLSKSSRSIKSIPVIARA